MPSTVEEIRARNLRHLCGPDRGGKTRMAEKLGKSQAQISQIIGEKRHKPIGSRQARDIERTLRLPRGWLDSEYHDLTTEGVAVARWFQALTPEQRAAFLALNLPPTK